MSRAESRPHDQTFDRWTAIGGLIAGGALALGLPGLASAANRVPVWRLDAVHGQGAGAYAANCAGCHACRSHALNRVFANKDAAVKGKAHAGCNCKIVKATMSEANFIKLFGPVGKPERDVIDRRWASSRKALRSAKPAQKKTAQKAKI